MPSRSQTAADVELCHARFGFTENDFGRLPTGVRWVRRCELALADPLKSFGLVMNYRTKTQWPRHLA